MLTLLTQSSSPSEKRVPQTLDWLSRCSVQDQYQTGYSRSPPVPEVVKISLKSPASLFAYSLSVRRSRVGMNHLPIALPSARPL